MSAHAFVNEPLRLHFSISDAKARWPVKPATFFVRLQQRIGTELKEMASIFKPKIADNSFQDINVFEADARGSFPGQVLGRLLFSIHISGSMRQLSFLNRNPKNLNPLTQERGQAFRRLD
jgi:hypothetical protein